VNYKQEALADFAARRTNGKGYDIVFDTVGATSLQNSFGLAKLNGKVIFIGTAESHDLRPAYVRGVSLIGVLMLIPLLTGEGRERHGEILRRMTELIEAGAIRPLVDPTRFGFDQVGAAHERLESGAAVGKIAISR